MRHVKVIVNYDHSVSFWHPVPLGLGSLCDSVIAAGTQLAPPKRVP